MTDPYNTADDLRPSPEASSNATQEPQASATPPRYVRRRSRHRAVGNACGNCEIPLHLTLADLMVMGRRSWRHKCPRCGFTNRLPIYAEAGCLVLTMLASGVVFASVSMGVKGLEWLGFLLVAVSWPLWGGIARMIYLDRGKLVSVGY